MGPIRADEQAKVGFSDLRFRSHLIASSTATSSWVAKMFGEIESVLRRLSIVAYLAERNNFVTPVFWRYAGNFFKSAFGRE